MTFDDLFRMLEPPPGGLEALRDRMAELPARRARRRRVRVLAGEVAAAALLAACLLLPALARRAGRDRFTELALRSGVLSLVPPDMAEAPRRRVRVAGESEGRAAVLEIPTGSPDVLLFWVMRVAPEPAATGDGTSWEEKGHGA